MPESNLSRLGSLLQYTSRGAQQAQNTSNQLPPTYGTIVDVNDPEERGRVKVVLDEVNPVFLGEKGLSQNDAKPTQSDWIEPLVPFKGLQPEVLKTKRMRVPVTARNGDPNRLAFGDPVFDPGESSSAEQPSNSAMTRLPVYPSGELPPATEENIGCVIVEQGGPQGFDWLMVCLNRGGYKWVRHTDRLHYHTGQLPDNDPGDASSNDTQNRTYDDIIVTTDSPLEGTD